MQLPTNLATIALLAPLALVGACGERDRNTTEDPTSSSTSAQTAAPSIGKGEVKYYACEGYLEWRTYGPDAPEHREDLFLQLGGWDGGASPIYPRYVSVGPYQSPQLRYRFVTATYFMPIAERALHACAEAYGSAPFEDREGINGGPRIGCGVTCAEIPPPDPPPPTPPTPTPTPARNVESNAAR